MTQRAENSYLRSLSLKLTNRHRRQTVPDRLQKEKVLSGHEMKLHGAPSKLLVGLWVSKAPLQPTPTHLLAARTPVHEDSGRDHDAPLVHFVLCDTGSWRTRRCEVIRIGDRDDAGQIASFMPMRTPVSGDSAFGYIVNSPGLVGSVRVKLTTGHRYLRMRKRRYRRLRRSCCSSTQVQDTALTHP